MPAYVISEVTIVDEERAVAYRELAAASIARHHGRYLSRGLRPDVVEGDWDDDARLIVVEFPDLATARRWYASPEYAQALALSGAALKRRLLFLDGT